MFSKLESLRGVAACFVVFYHTYFNFYDRKFAFFSHSWIFVDFFFILSGFVMAHAYSKKISEGLSVIDYSTLRLGRIYPLHLFTLFIFIPFNLLKYYLYHYHNFGNTDPFIKSDLYSFFLNVFLIQSFPIIDHKSWNFVSWSISVEFWAYIVFFVYIRFFKNLNQAITALVISICVYVFLYLKNHQFDLELTYNGGFYRCLGAFFLGVFIYSIRSEKFPAIKLAAFIELALLALIFLSVSFIKINPMLQITSIILFSIVILIYSYELDTIGSKILNHPYTRAVGRWSYSIYMVHVLILIVIESLVQHVAGLNPSIGHGFISLAVNLFSLLIVIAIASQTYRFIEVPFRNMSKNYVMNKLNQR